MSSISHPTIYVPFTHIINIYFLVLMPFDPLKAPDESLQAFFASFSCSAFASLSRLCSGVNPSVLGFLGLPPALA